MRKKIIAVFLAVAVVCGSVMYQQKSAQAAVLNKSDVMSLELFAAIDADNSSSRELSSSLSDQNVAGSAGWLMEKVFDSCGKHGVEFAADDFSREMEIGLQGMLSSGKICVDGKNRLTELSKAYVVNAALQVLGSMADVSGEASEESYAELASEYVDLDTALARLEQMAGGKELSSVVTDQIAAVDTLALTLQFQAAESEPDSSLYADKFYAINEVRTCLDTLYSATEEYGSVAGEIGESVNDLAENTKDSVDESVFETVSQMNAVQPLVSGYVTREVTQQKVSAAPEKVSDEGGSDVSGGKGEEEAAGRQDTGKDAGSQMTLTAADIDFVSAMFDEKMSAIVMELSQSAYEQAILMTTDEASDGNKYVMGIAAEDLAEVQQSVDGVAEDVTTLQTKFNTLELRTRNDVMILGDEVDEQAGAISDLQNSVTTLQDRSKNDASVLIGHQEETDSRLDVIESQNVVTTISNITINAASGSGSNPLDTNTEKSSYIGKWAGSGSTYYIDIVNDAIIAGSDIDIKYSGEPNIIPSYTMNASTHTLRITVNNNSPTNIGVIYIYSKINA